MRLCNARDNVMFKQIDDVFFKPEFDIALRTERRIGGHSYIKKFSQIDEGLLGKVRMMFDLKNLRFVTRVAHHIEDE